jgi:hypothetical protein
VIEAIRREHMNSIDIEAVKQRIYQVAKIMNFYKAVSNNSRPAGLTGYHFYRVTSLCQMF